MSTTPNSMSTEMSGSCSDRRAIKGTEFSKVLLFGVDQGAIPRPLRDEQYAEDAWADALLRERSLLYVAATRARDELALSWSGDPSQLLPSASG